MRGLQLSAANSGRPIAPLCANFHRARHIDEMERVGMVLCLSHAGARTVAYALEYSHRPEIVSHSNPFGDTPHARNVSDDLMVACARKGGMVGLTGFAPFLGANDDLVNRLLRQLRYVIDLIGAQHLGPGLDGEIPRSFRPGSIHLMA